MYQLIVVGDTKVNMLDGSVLWRAPAAPILHNILLWEAKMQLRGFAVVRSKEHELMVRHLYRRANKERKRG